MKLNAANALVQYWRAQVPDMYIISALHEASMYAALSDYMGSLRNEIVLGILHNAKERLKAIDATNAAKPELVEEVRNFAHFFLHSSDDYLLSYPDIDVVFEVCYCSLSQSFADFSSDSEAGKPVFRRYSDPL